ncbi:plasmid stabilization system protein ParE [Parabacteroides sp. PF5-5]|uniref:Dabb family protein n=1 Tax=unclassified Parabacteroides TaxID=2649774 RepID=UPI002474B5F0|nr:MULTISPECIES: Dabb family protein [unclassified Parabacteroides]MDH6303812.1 plasmid stabilization system protein ParE [Parabacteroides sp. PH5-39]MDH6314429.1 plasmid stabilization system protein ParE [Parabacteroides sp. PF5-13]MDH6318506.1 plasmid stabilization system protein ParE [Parabacteroides sp. PH5-13]MDH6322201.1 plasmid stabilization system protein ParE [Parabacteroides sp. PH5-8]MDH6325719.1 plasmid stabilization system protein ParE [Parabacteroides sp. PH5-41]
MIRHIVMFKLKEFATQAEKQTKIEEIKTRLEALKGRIDILLHISVDFNVNPAETWDLILTTEFKSLEDLAVYANHPEHVEVTKNCIAPVKADRACVDYVF